MQRRALSSSATLPTHLPTFFVENIFVSLFSTFLLIRPSCAQPFSSDPSIYSHSCSPNFFWHKQIKNAGLPISHHFCRSQFHFDFPVSVAPEVEMKKTEFLGPRETFEFYEKRAHSPLNYARPDTAPSPPQPLSSLEMQPASRVEYIPATYAYVPVEQQKRKVPLGWLIGLAVVVPIFVILMLFLAVWLQEMGII